MARTKPGTDHILKSKTRRNIWSWSVSFWSLHHMHLTFQFRPGPPPNPPKSAGNGRKWRPRSPQEKSNGRTPNKKHKIPSKSPPRKSCITCTGPKTPGPGPRRPAPCLGALGPDRQLPDWGLLLTYHMLRNSASGPVLGLPGHISDSNRESLKIGTPGRPKAGRRSDFDVFPTRIRQKSGPKDRFPARKHRCITPLVGSLAALRGRVSPYSTVA
jgi:hypothetical protein